MNQNAIFISIILNILTTSTSSTITATNYYGIVIFDVFFVLFDFLKKYFKIIHLKSR